jgi:hypothetical protein
VRDLALGAGVAVRLPPGLDGDEVIVELRARRVDELRGASERLQAAVNGGGFDRVFDILDETS